MGEETKSYNLILQALLISLVFGLGWSLSWAVSAALFYFGVQILVGISIPAVFVGLGAFALAIGLSGIGWIFSGLGLSLVLWWRQDNFRLKHASLMGFGWWVGGGLGFPVVFGTFLIVGCVFGMLAGSFLAGYSLLHNVLATIVLVAFCALSLLIGWLLSGPIVGVIVSLVTSLALWWSSRIVGWRRVLFLTITWSFSLAVGWFISASISGLVWYSLNIGRDIVAGEFNRAIIRAIEIGAGGVVGGMAGGIVGGGLGTILMIWQLGRTSRSEKVA